MRVRAILLVSVLQLLLPQPALASLELGTTSAVALNLEQPRWSAGLGLDVHWRVYHDFYFVDPGLGIGFGDATLFVLTPSVAARLFLSRDQELQPFISTRVQHDVPIVNAQNKVLAEILRDASDGWLADLGAGIRTAVKPRVAIGGEVVFRTRFLSFQDQKTDVNGEMGFLVFLQYRP